MVVNLGSVLVGDQEAWDSNHVVVDHDVPLSDSGSGVVDGVSQLGLEDNGLESPVEELLNAEGQNVIESVLSGLIQQLEFEHPLQKGASLEQSLRVLLLKGQKLSGSLSDSGEGELDSPHFTLALETVLSADSDLVLDSLLFEGSSWGLGSLGT